MLHKDSICLALREGWGGAESPFHISKDALRRHIYVVGKTGTGKSTLLKLLLLQVIALRDGAALLDPHGDLSDDILASLPASLASRVVYFNPGDLSFPIGWNVFAGVPVDERPRVASQVVSAFQHVWADSWGPRLAYILYNSLRSLLDAEHTTILGLPKLLTDSRYRQWVVRQVKDPFIAAFWHNEFEAYDHRFRQEAIAPILNKIGPVVTDPALRNTLGQMKRRLNIQSIMDNGQVLIANLSKGVLGEATSSLLGALLVSEFQHAAMSRASKRDVSRPDFALIVDEFPSFATGAFAPILSEARKFHLSLVLSHQFTSQIEPAIRDAVFGNVGTMVSFQLGFQDAEIMAKAYGEAFAASQFVNLDPFRILVKPCAVDGGPSQPFPGRTEPPPRQSEPSARDTIIHLSRKRYCSDRAHVEQKIQRWMQSWE